MGDLEVVVRENPAVNVTVVGEPASRVKVDLVPLPPRVITIKERGPAGLPGEKGEPGSVAPGTGDLSYVHVQSVLSSKWRIPHGMGRRPSGSFFDTAGTQWHPDVIHESNDVMLADYGTLEIAGTAYLD